MTTVIPLQLKLKYQKLLKSANGEEADYLDVRTHALIKELYNYSDVKDRIELFKQLESIYGQVPGKFRGPFRWYK